MLQDVELLIFTPVTQTLEDGAKWQITSDTDSSNNYTIIKMSSECTATVCAVKCIEKECLGLCRHMYQCSCYDYHNGHVCKHLHRLHSLLQQQSSSTSDSTPQLLLAQPQSRQTKKPIGELGKHNHVNFYNVGLYYRHRSYQRSMYEKVERTDVCH